MVTCGNEAVLLGRATEPLLEFAVGELNDAVAPGADEMVVVILAAHPVAELAGVVGNRVDDSPLVEQSERPVDGGEPDAAAFRAHAGVQALGRDVVALSGELGDDRDALGGRAEAVPLEQPLGRLSWARLHRSLLEAILLEAIMRTVLILTAAGAALAVAVVGCGGSTDGSTGEPPAAEEQLAVIAGFYPLAYAAELIGGDIVSVENLTPPGVEPHDLELSARDVERVRAADLVVYLGQGFQPALEDAVEGAGGRALDLLEGLPLEGQDPHVWLDPSLYAKIVGRLGEELGRTAAADALVDDLVGLDQELEQGLANCERRVIVTGHEAFTYLAARYGLEQIAVTGLSPEAEPSPRDLQGVVEAVRESGATTVFAETLVSPELAETIAREAGAEVAVLNPLEGVTEDERKAGADYFSVMRENLAVLREALECR
jgi:zinc transport system substrate-binding protein